VFLKLGTPVVVAATLLLADVGADAGPAPICATLTTTVQGQAPVQEALSLTVGATLAGGTMVELVGSSVASDEVLRGAAALLPGGATARVGLTIVDATLKNARDVGLLVTLATASGTGVFTRLDGASGTAAVHFGACP